MPTSVPLVFDKLIGPIYWERLLKDDRRISLLRAWLRVVGTAMYYQDTLAETIECLDLERELIARCDTIDDLVYAFGEDAHLTHLDIFGEKEHKLKKQQRLTNLSLLDLAVWCIARLREIEEVNLAVPTQELM